MSFTEELRELTNAAIARKKREQQEKGRIQNAIFAEKERIFSIFLASERTVYWKEMLHNNLMKAALEGESKLIMKFDINDFTIQGIVTSYAIIHLGTPYEVFHLWFNYFEELKGTRYARSDGDQSEFEFIFDWSIKPKHY
jgi:hypothetical protein